MITRLLVFGLMVSAGCLYGQTSEAKATSDSIDTLRPTMCGPGNNKTNIYKDITVLDGVSTTFVNGTFHQNSLSQVIDNYVDDAHIHLETTADYDKPNPYLIAFTGASYKWTKHNYDNIRIDNPLIAGDAAYHFNLENTDINWDSHLGAIYLNPNSKRQRSLSTKGLSGSSLGGRVGFTDWFLNNISGHRSAGERSIFEIKQRPYTSWHSEITYTNNTGTNPLYINVFGGSRAHVDQDFTGSNTSYEEQYLQILAAGNLTNRTHVLGDGIEYIFRYSERDNYGAEYQYDRPETAKLFQLSTSIYSKKELIDDGHQTVGLTINTLRKASIDLNFSRNIIDQDGEGIHPYEQDGRQQSYGVYFKRKENLKPNIALMLEANNSVILHNPSENKRRNAVYRQSTADNYLSLHAIDWQQEGFASGLIENSAIVSYQSKKNSSISVSGGLHLYGMLVSDNNLLNIGLSTDVSWQGHLSKKWDLGVKFGFYPNRYDIDQIRLLSNDYLNGSARYWDDTNQDKLAQDSELGSIAYTTGGSSHSRSEDLGLSYTYYLDLPISYKASKNWTWTLMAQYRQYRNTWSVEYERPAKELGDYSNISDRELWFSNGGVQSYVVQPLSTERMNTGREGSSFLFDQPFYGGVTFRFEHQSQRWFFTGSMTANMIVGYAGLGNGPLHNNINAPSETTANPNTLINQVGRLDTDRSFISRWVANYKYSNNGSIGITLKYKDGQSFAYYENYIKELPDGGREIAFYQPEVRGDHPLTGERGRREDFFTNFELHGQHSFLVGKGTLQVRLVLHNLLDFANETSEYIFGNIEGFSRSPLELQVPRSASVEFSYSW